MTGKVKEAGDPAVAWYGWGSRSPFPNFGTLCAVAGYVGPRFLELANCPKTGSVGPPKTDRGRAYFQRA
jgi:hypothetical protein